MPNGYLLAQILKLAASFRTELNATTQSVYMDFLREYKPEDVTQAFEKLVSTSKFFPTIAEIKEKLSDVFAERHRAIASQKNRLLLSRPAKPDDWDFKLEDAYEEIDARALALWERDMAFILTDDDHKWPKPGRSGDHEIKGRFLCRCPKHGDKTAQMAWVCYDRIMEAKKGIKPRSAVMLHKRFKEIAKV